MSQAQKRGALRPPRSASRQTSTTPKEATGHLQLRGLVKIYDPASEVRAVDEVDLDVSPGEFVTLLGPSGCGKTTILRTIAGFEDPTSGALLLDGSEVSGMPPHRRPVSMVFQSYALFPHMSVAENVGYGLRSQRLRGSSVTDAVEQALDTMGLTPYGDRFPAQLSGGQQQRVALARAMVMRPKVMLFDEPLSNLDAALREQMRLEIRRLQRQLGVTAIYVTHDQAEAMAMSDRVVVLDHGRIQQIGTPTQIYRHPASAFVAGFVGRANMLPVTVHDVTDGQAQITVLGMAVKVPAHPDVTSKDGDAQLLVRPESLQLQRVDAVDPGASKTADPDAVALTEPSASVPPTGSQAPIAVVTATVFMGERIEYELELAGRRLLATVVDPTDEDLIAEGASVRLGITASKTWLLPPEPA